MSRHNYVVVLLFDAHAHEYCSMSIFGIQCIREKPVLPAGIVYGANYPLNTVGAQSVRIFDPIGQNYSQVAIMQSLRWYPTVMTLPDGSMLIIGGAQAVSDCSSRHGSSRSPCIIKCR